MARTQVSQSPRRSSSLRRHPREPSRHVKHQNSRPVCVRTAYVRWAQPPKCDSSSRLTRRGGPDAASVLRRVARHASSVRSSATSDGSRNGAAPFTDVLIAADAMIRLASWSRSRSGAWRASACSGVAATISATAIAAPWPLDECIDRLEEKSLRRRRRVNLPLEKESGRRSRWMRYAWPRTLDAEENISIHP